MKKSIQIALASIALILTSILGLTIMLHGMYSKINVKGAAETRANDTMINISVGNPDYTGMIKSAWYTPTGGREDNSQITVRELGGDANTVGGNGNQTITADNIRAFVNNPNQYGKKVGNQWHYWLSIRQNVKAEFNDTYVLPSNTVVHLLLNGYDISGNFKIEATPGFNSALKLYDYIPGNIWQTIDTKYYNGVDPRYNNRPVRFYAFDDRTNAYTKFIDARTDNTVPSSLNGYTETTVQPTFATKTYIKVDGSVIAPGIKGSSGAVDFTATTALTGNIELYGVHIVGNTSPTTAGLINNKGGSGSSVKLINSNIIGNSVTAGYAAIALNNSSELVMKWCNIYANYAGGRLGTTTINNIKVSDIYAPATMDRIVFENNMLGTFSMNENYKVGSIFLRRTNLYSFSFDKSNKSLLTTIEEQAITGDMSLNSGATYTIRLNWRALNIQLRGRGNTLKVNSGVTVAGTMSEDTNSSSNKYIIAGAIPNNTVISHNGTVDLQRTETTILQGSKSDSVTSVYGGGTAQLNGGQAKVPDGQTLNKLQHTNGSTVMVESNATVGNISGSGTTTINGTVDAMVTQDGYITTINSSGKSPNISGNGTVNMNGGTAAIVSTTAPISLYGTGGTVTIAQASGAIVAQAKVIAGKTLGAEVTINNPGTLTIESNASVRSNITNNSTLNIAGNASNITGNGAVHMDGGVATITAGNSKLYGNSGQVTIDNNAIATVTNEAGKNTLTGTIINNGTLNVEGNASGATITNNKILNLKQGGSIPGNFTNNTNATLVVEQNASYTITNGLNGTVTNQGTVTITNGTVQTLNNNNGGNVIIDCGTNNNNSVKIENLTNNATFTVHSGTYIIPANKTLSGTVVNKENGIIELQGSLTSNNLTNNGWLRIPQGKIYDSNALSGKIRNSGTLNVNNPFNTTLINESTGTVNVNNTINGSLENYQGGTVNLGQNGTLPNNFTNNGTLVIGARVTKTITAPRGSGTIKNQGSLTISGNATVFNSPATTTDTVTLTITGGTVTTYGKATNIEVRSGGTLKVSADQDKSLTANTIESNGTIDISGEVTATTINSGYIFNVQSGGKAYGTITLSGNMISNIRGTVGDSSHTDTVLKISNQVNVYNGGNIWSLISDEATSSCILEEAGAVVNVRKRTDNQWGFAGWITNKKGTVNLHQDAYVSDLVNEVNSQGVNIMGDNVRIGWSINNKGTFTINQGVTYRLRTMNSSRPITLGGTVINNGILNVETNLSTATLTNNGTVYLAPGGTFPVDSTNNGTLVIQDGATADINAPRGTTGIIQNQGELTIAGNATVENSKTTNSSNVILNIKRGTINTSGSATTITGNGALWVQAGKNLTADTIDMTYRIEVSGTLTATTINSHKQFHIKPGGTVYGAVNILGADSPVIEGTLGDENHQDSILKLSAGFGMNITDGAKVWNVGGSGTLNLSHSNAIVNVRNINDSRFDGTINNNHGTVNLYDGATVGTLNNTANSNGVYVKGTNVTVTDSLDNKGTFTIEKTGSFTIQQGKTLGGTTINNGTLVVNGVVDNVSGNGTLTINKNGDVNGQATVTSTNTLDGTVENNGILNIQGTLLATTTFTNNGELNLADGVNYTVLSSMNLGGVINNRGTLTVEGTATVVNNHKDLTVDGTVKVVTNNTTTTRTNAQVRVNGTIEDLSGNGTVSISSSNANVTVVEGKKLTGIVTNNGGTLTVNGRADDVSGSGTLTINTNGDKIGEVTVISGKTLSGNVTNNGILNMDGTLDISDFVNEGTLRLNKGGDIVKPFTNNGTFQIGKDVTYEVREQDNLTNGTVVNNGVLTVGVGKINNLISTGTTDIQANANVTTLVVHEGYTTLYNDSVVGSAELKANGTLEIFNLADLTNLTHNENGTLIDHRMAPNPAMMGTRSFSWLWLLIIISGILLLILLILILLLIKRKREEVYVDEIYDRVEDISLYSRNEDK